MQVNKPIVDSPLLMASYVTHLAQVTIAKQNLHFPKKLIFKTKFSFAARIGHIAVCPSELMHFPRHCFNKTMMVDWFTSVQNWCHTSIHIQIGEKCVSFRDPTRTDLLVVHRLVWTLLRGRIRGIPALCYGNRITSKMKVIRKNLLWKCRDSLFDFSFYCSRQRIHEHSKWYGNTKFCDSSSERSCGSYAYTLTTGGITKVRGRSFQCSIYLANRFLATLPVIILSPFIFTVPSFCRVLQHSH